MISPDRVKEIADKAEARAGQSAKIGRPSTYTDEMAAHICSEISSGRSLRSICSDEGMPECKTVFRWISKNDNFRQQYTRAQEDRTAAMAEDILEIADDKECPDVQQAKLRIDTRKWLMAKMAPKKYGDKIELGGGVEHKLVLGDMTDEQLANIAAKGRAGATSETEG